MDPSDWSQPEAGNLRHPPFIDPQLESFPEGEAPLSEAERGTKPGPPLTMHLHLGGMAGQTGQYANLVAGVGSGPQAKRCLWIHKKGTGIFPNAPGMLSCHKGV